MGNTESAVSLLNYNNLYANGCQFYNNSRAIKGALHCQINVTDTEFIQNKAIEGGSFHVSMATNVYLHNCSFTDNFASWKGGVIAAVNSDIKIFDCKFTENEAMIAGGVFTISGILFVKDSVISNNYVHGDGGVAYLEENSLVEIQDSYFLMNIADGVGGVLSMTRGTARVSNSSFVSNRAQIRGGVIDAQYSSMINISRTKCYGNQATNGHGGVVHARVDTKVYVHNSIFIKNSAHTCGAVLIDVASVLETSFSQFKQNNAFNMAGVFCAFNNSLFVSQTSLFKENKRKRGGSLIVQNSTGYLENGTFVKNQGPIILSMAVLRLSNTVFVQNMALEAVDIDNKFGFINKLYTYRSLFKHKNITLKSNSRNFKHIASMKQFLQGTSYLTTDETQFASSKLKYFELVSLFYRYV